MEIHNMMEAHHVMGFHHCVIRQINCSCEGEGCTTSVMSLVKSLFVASIASLTLAMTSRASTIQLMQQMRILPAFGTCSNCSLPTGAYKSDGLYNYLGLILQEEAVIVGQYCPHKQQHKDA